VPVSLPQDYVAPQAAPVPAHENSEAATAAPKNTE
jgi:hypothetical protein